MSIQRVAAFSAGESGGNPAGVVVGKYLPDVDEMKQVARDVGYSETVFAACEGASWRVRYFSPDAEIPFCGHATIALGAVLAMQYGPQKFHLDTLAGHIEVEGILSRNTWGASLRSPATWNMPVSPLRLDAALQGLGLAKEDVNFGVPPALVHAGADHLFIALHDRAKLAGMHYEFESFQRLMRENGWVTVALCFIESSSVLHVRNAFAYGGVYEDPATGAAAAAIAAYLRDIGWSWPDLEFLQGDDMGIPCRLHARAESGAGSPVVVSGTARKI